MRYFVAREAPLCQNSFRAQEPTDFVMNTAVGQQASAACLYRNNAPVILRRILSLSDGRKFDVISPSRPTHILGVCLHCVGDARHLCCHLFSALLTSDLK